MLTCPECGNIVEEGSAYCAVCGYSLDKKTEGALKCPVCSSPNARDSTLCAACGASLASEVPSQPSGPVASQHPEQPVKKTSRLAIAALICGILPTILVGFVLAIVAIFVIDANRSTQKGMHLAVIGGMLSVLWMYVAIAGIVNYADSQTGGMFGSMLKQGVESGGAFQREGATVYTLVAGDRHQTENLSVKEQKIMLAKSADKMSARIKREFSKTVMIVPTGTTTISMMVAGSADQDKVKQLILASKDLPVKLVIVEEYVMDASGERIMD